MKLEMMSVPRVRIGELHSLTEGVLKLCKPHQSLQSAVSAVETVFAQFAPAVLKTQASAEEKSALDKERDQLLSGFFYAIRAERLFPQTEQQEKVLNQLHSITEKYRVEIRKLPLNEETAQVDFLLNELANLDLQPLQAAGLHRWAPQLKTVNEAFKKATEGFVSDSATAEQQQSASDIAPSLFSALEGLYSMFYAFMHINPSPELSQSYAELKVMTDSYR